MSLLNITTHQESPPPFNRKKWNDLGSNGIFAMPVAKKFGGANKSYQQIAQDMIAYGKSDNDNGFMLAAGAHIWAGIMPIQLFALEEQQKEYLPVLASGEKIAAHAITEDIAGSDVNGINTIAKKVEGGFILSGKKTLITNAPVADIFLVLAKTETSNHRTHLSTFIITKHTEGLSVTNSFSKMGLGSAQMGAITLNKCFVPTSNILGVEGQGQSIFLKTMELERSMILAPAVGRMKALLAIAMERLKQRREKNTDISHHQYVQEKIVALELNIETSQNLLMSTARRLDNGRLAMKYAAMTKLLLSRNWENSASNVMSLYGGHGYLVDNFIEQELRDAIGSRYYSGTDEVQKNTIFSLAGL